MSQKAICPRGHMWDPSMLGGLPPTEKPRCPICGEEEPLRASNALARFGRWCRNNPALTVLSLLCLFLCVGGLTAIVQARRATQAALEAAEKNRFEAEQTTARLRSHLRVEVVEDKDQRQKRQDEVEAARWRDREASFQKQLREVEQARRDAVKQRDEQAHDRRLAEELTRTAEEVRQEALSRRAETARQLVKVYVAEGTRLMERGDLSASLLWYAEALRLAQKEKLPEEAHRLRVAAVLAQCPRPVQVATHDKQVKAVQLSADGTRVLTVTADAAARVTETTTGKRIGEPMAHEEAIAHAVFSPDGKRVLTATTDLMVHEWDVDTGKEVFAAAQLMGPIVGLRFSPDGKRFLVVTDKAAMGAMGATEVELHVRDAATGEAVREESLGSELRPFPASFSPDGRSVLALCQDRCARSWDIASGKQIGSSFGHAAALVHASFSPDGERVLTASADGTARVWQTKTGEPVTPPLKHGSTVSGAAFSPAGRHVLTFGVDRAVRVWDANKGETVGPSLRHTEAVNNAVFSPDGRYVLTTSDDDAVRIWDYQRGEEILPALRHGEPIRFAVFTPAGDAVLTWCGQVVRLWDLTTAEPTIPPLPRREAELTVFSADGKRELRVIDTVVRIYDTEKKEAIVTLPHTNKVSAAAFSANGQRLLTVSHQPNGDEMEGHVRVWETATGRLIGAALVHPRSVLEASLSPDGKRVLTACQDGKARLWDADTSRVIGESMGHKEDLTRALFLPDGKRLLTVDVEGGMRLWDALTAEAVGPTWGHRKAVHQLVFSPDGEKLVTASADGTARVWEANTGREIAATPAQSAPVVQAVFSADGKRIATVSDDRRARVWDAGTGKPVGPSLRHRAAITLVAFSADGKRLATVAVDGLRIWDAVSGEPIGPVLRHTPAQPIIRGVALGRDGRLVLSFGAVGDPSARWSSDFRAEERPLEDVLHIAEVLSGQRMADAGATTALDDATLVKEWRDARTKYATDFAPSAKRVAAWDRRGVAECEQQQLWIGVVLHIDRLLSAGASVDLYAQRARANREIHSWKAAQADYTKALAGEGARWDPWAGRAEVEAALGRWDEALADYSKAIERKGDRAELWTARGRIEAERGEWSKAAADLGKAIHLGDETVTVWCQHILALLASGDEANYRRWCARLVQRFGDSKDEAVARRVAWTCALADGSLRDWKALLKRAEQMATAHPQSTDHLRLFAVVLYRAGEYDASLKQAQKMTKLSDPAPQARDWLLTALAEQRLGRGGDAKKSLEKAEEVRAKEKNDKESWEYRLVYQTLHRESETLIKGGKR
jgi:WD40 repeat protein/tetratricopeptide (TPR) repeat protein